MRVIRKLLVPTLVFVGFIIAGLVAYNALITVQKSNAVEEERLNNMYRIFLARIASQESFAVALAIETADNIEIQKAFAEQDHERLTELTLPGYQEIDARFGVPVGHFHLPPAISFLRLHSLDKYGDDISAFRPMIVEANQGKQIIQGIEIGRVGLGIRGVSPVEYNDNHIGTVEYGLNLDQQLLNTLKEEFGFDFQIGISQEAAKVVTFVASDFFEDKQNDQIILQSSTLEEPFLASSRNYTQALSGAPTLEHLSINNSEYAVLTVPIIDFSGTVVGTIDIISDHTAIVVQQRNQIILSVSILLGMLLLVGFGFSAIAGRILRPIAILTNTANAIAAGDFSKKANVRSDDELGVLSQAFTTMSEQIQENVRTLEQRVADRTKNQEIVAEIATKIGSIPDREEMLATMVHLTQRGFGLYHAHVFTYHEENQDEELAIIACGYREGDEHEGTHGTSTIAYNNEHSIVARCARDKQPVIVNDAVNSPDWLPNPLLPETRAELAVPLIVGDLLLGVLDVQADYIDAFDEGAVHIQSTLAAQIAVSLQNILQSETTQKVAADLSVVAEVGIATATITDQKQLLQEVVDLSKKSFDLYHAHIYLLNEQGDTLQLASGAGEVGREMVSEGLSIPLDSEQSLVARAARTREGVLVNDVTLDPNFLPNPLLPQTRAEMAVPMISAGKLVGVLDVQSARVGRFTNIDINIKTTLASQIAVAVENTRSFQNAQKQAERETKLNTITQKIQHATTIEEAMQIAARELGHALGKRQTSISLNTTAGNDEKESSNE